MVLQSVMCKSVSVCKALFISDCATFALTSHLVCGVMVKNVLVDCMCYLS